MDSEILKQLIEISKNKNVTYEVTTIGIHEEDKRTITTLKITQAVDYNNVFDAAVNKFVPVINDIIDQLKTEKAL